MNAKILAASLAAAAALNGAAQKPQAEQVRAATAAAPRSVTLMIAGFGTVESVAQVDAWLGEQLAPRQNLAAPPALTEGERIKAPELDREAVRINWNTRQIEYLKNAEEIDRENTHRKQLLTNLRTAAIANEATRYVPLAKDYLQAALAESGYTMVKIIDRSNADIAAVENALAGKADSFAAAGCVLTAALGDREEEVRTVTVNAAGAKVQTTVYTQPYVGKIRDMSGNVLTAFKGAATWRASRNSVVATTAPDPARKLVEQVCAQIAEKIAAYFTAEISFRLKVPSDLDEDEVIVNLDGREVDVQAGGLRVLAVDHAVEATLEGCRPIRKIVSFDGATDKKTVKLVFKKLKHRPAPAAPAAEAQ